MRLNSLALCSLSALLTLPALEAGALAPSLRYTAPEQRALAAMDSESSGGAARQIQALQNLSGHTDFATPRAQALLAMLQCDTAVRGKLDPKIYVKRLSQIKKDVGDSDPAPAVLEAQCELTRQQFAGKPPAFEQVLGHYRSAQNIGLPTLQYDVASSYSELATSLGLLDEAMRATESALAIANANGDVPYQRNSLMDMALIQANLGLHDEALRNSAAALALGKGAGYISLLSNRGYVQVRAKELDAAEVTYKEVLNLARKQPNREESQLTALTNLAAIYSSQGRTAENLAASREAMRLAQGFNQPSVIGYAELAYALALAESGDIESARPLFNRGQDHLEQASEQSSLVEYLTRWSQQLAKQKLWQEAYLAIENARQLNEDINANQRKRSGQYLSAIHESAQKDQAISALQQKNRIAELEAQQRKIATIAWALGLCALVMMLVVLAGLYLRLRKANAQLNHENAHDTLTRLHNRPFFTKHFQNRTRQSNGDRAILALLDIDHFKTINDTWGHAVGDEVLQQISTRLRGALRSDDMIARWGGEEIAIFVENLHPNLRASDFAERLRNTVARKPLHVAGNEIPVSASIGYIEFPLVRDSRLDDLLEQVDANLYAAKRNGRNQAVGTALADKSDQVCATTE